MVPTEFSSLAHDVYSSKYEKDGEGWRGTSFRVPTHVLGALGYAADSREVLQIASLVYQRKFMPGGRYFYAAGRPYHQTQNCLLMRADDSQEGWADLMYKVTVGLMSGAGVGIEYSDVRPRGSVLTKKGGVASGPLSLMEMVNETGRHVMQGGTRRSAIWAGLAWDHPDCCDFIHAKDWSPEVRALKEVDTDFPARLDKTNISVRYNAEFFVAYHDVDHPKHVLAHTIYWAALTRMLKTGEPGFSIDMDDQILRNACTEVISADDSDICNLGSINLARVESLDELAHVTDLATLFLLAGTVYSDVPYPKVADVRERNRRLGLGVMGPAEWLAVRGKPYAPDAELGEWMSTYERESNRAASAYADYHGLSIPIAVRAIAPTGTIGLIAETTTGIEPIFCTAYKRRYLKGEQYHYQYVVDPTARRLVERGVDPDDIQDAYTIDPEARVRFQAWMQTFVDQGISSTINIARRITNPREIEAFGNMLIGYLPALRGVTVYPDGARGGQPFTPVSYDEAVTQEGVVYDEAEDKCVGGVCGI